MNMCSHFIKNKILSKRAFTLSRNKDAILTIEASVVLPLFLMAVVLVLSISSAIYISEKIDCCIYEEAENISLLKLNATDYGVSGIEANTKYKLGDKLLNNGMIKDGEHGLDFSDTDLSDDEIVELSVKYTIVFPFDAFGILQLPLENRIIMHNASGYKKGLNGYESDDYVYMTTTGSVYHRSRECSHIKLSIKKIASNELPDVRNDNGKKYKQCSTCKPKASDELLYITKDGDKYHRTLACSGLKRIVKRVKLSQIGSIPPCSKCGY